MQRNRLNDLVMAIGAASLCLISLTACGKQQIDLSGKADQIASKSVTLGSGEVVFPDDKPSVADGKAVWNKQNCAQCHNADGAGVAKANFADKNYMRLQKPVDQYEFIWTGKEGVKHPTLQGVLSRREAWNVVFYTRAISTPLLTDEELMPIDAVFGSNCAVCHGKKGYGDGPLAHNLEPVPANFQQFDRFYDRTDAILWDHIANGIKWEGMPNFRGKEDKAKNVKFDDEYIWKLVQYVRHFHEQNEPTIAAGGAGTTTKAETTQSSEKEPAKAQ
jgi:mono/diheme cytochrome c family protein